MEWIEGLFAGAEPNCEHEWKTRLPAESDECAAKGAITDWFQPLRL
jgi:hypothetical protein